MKCGLAVRAGGHGMVVNTKCSLHLSHLYSQTLNSVKLDFPHFINLNSYRVPLLVTMEWEYNENLLMCVGGWLVLSFVRSFVGYENKYSRFPVHYVI